MANMPMAVVLIKAIGITNQTMYDYTQIRIVFFLRRDVTRVFQ